MVDRFTGKAKEGRIVLRIDADFEEQVNELAFRRFEGNRSMLVRTALRDLLRKEQQVSEPVELETAA
jgi:metal-responsive CopG/Arc/MetJ family transcriptional regulator